MESSHIQLVSELYLFREVPKATVNSLIRDGHIRVIEYRKNQIVHSEGDDCTHVEIVMTGNLVVQHIDESGDLLVVAKFGANDLIGGNLVYSLHARYPMTITSLGNTQVVTISGANLFTLLTAHPSMLKTFLHMISANTLVLNNKITRYLNSTIRECLVTFLRQESIKQHTTMVKLPFSKTHLAEILGVQRTSVSRELKKMKDDGLIDFKRDHISLLGIDLEV
jgi:CRP/FNR family transcriptional regulator, dissimilatory nitrate respiration regulator